MLVYPMLVYPIFPWDTQGILDPLDPTACWIFGCPARWVANIETPKPKNPPVC